MGQRGPSRTPTRVLKLRGSWLGRARARAGEPRPAKGRPPTPAWLDARGKAAFRWMVRRLEDAGLLTLLDAKAIERYCATYARWREAELLIRADGQVMEVVLADGSRVPRKNPAVAIAAELASQLARLEGQLGLTPAARAGLTAQVDPAAGTLDSELVRKYFDSPAPRFTGGRP